MRQISNTIKFISFYSSYFKKKPPKNIKIFCDTNKIKISKKLLRNIILFKYDNNMNNLVRDLSKEIKQKKYLLPIYNMIDEIYHNRRMQKNKNHQKKNNQSILYQLKKNDPEKFIKLKQCFLEEATVRNIDVNIENFHYWCHTTNSKLKAAHKSIKKEIEEMTPNSFKKLIDEISKDIKKIKNQKIIVKSEEIIKAYNILELNLGLNHKKIRQQYLKLTKKHHPDVGGSVEKMADINRAYQLLMSTEKNILKIL